MTEAIVAPATRAHVVDTTPPATPSIINADTARTETEVLAALGRLEEPLHVIEDEGASPSVIVRLAVHDCWPTPGRLTLLCWVTPPS